MQQFVHVSLVFTELLTNSILNKKNKKEKASNSSLNPYTVCRMASFASAWLLMECRSLGCTTLDVCLFGRCPHCVFDTTSLLKIRYCARLSAYSCLQQQGQGSLAELCSTVFNNKGRVPWQAQDSAVFSSKGLVPCFCPLPLSPTVVVLKYLSSTYALAKSQVKSE